MALRFQACCQGECPDKAVVACKDDDGRDLVVGRAVFKGGLHPGKLNPSHSSLYVSYGGEEVPIKEYEILIQEGRDNLHWVEAKGGDVPPAALKVLCLPYFFAFFAFFLFVNFCLFWCRLLLHCMFFFLHF